MNGPRYIESNLDEALYRQRCYQIHQERLKNIETKKESSLAKQQDQLRHKVRESKMRNHIFTYNEKNASINRENEVLMTKLIQISKGKWSSINPVKPPVPGYRPHSLNVVNRKLESERITSENHTLAKRILEKPSSINKRNLDQNYVNQRKYQSIVRKSNRTKGPVFQGRLGHLPPIKIETSKGTKGFGRGKANSSTQSEMNKTAPLMEASLLNSNVAKVSQQDQQEVEDEEQKEKPQTQKSPRLGGKRKSVGSEKKKIGAYMAEVSYSPRRQESKKSNVSKRMKSKDNNEIQEDVQKALKQKQAEISSKKSLEPSEKLSQKKSEKVLPTEKEPKKETEPDEKSEKGVAPEKEEVVSEKQLSQKVLSQSQAPPSQSEKKVSQKEIASMKSEKAIQEEQKEKTQQKEEEPKSQEPKQEENYEEQGFAEEEPKKEEKSEVAESEAKVDDKQGQEETPQDDKSEQKDEPTELKQEDKQSEKQSEAVKASEENDGEKKEEKGEEKGDEKGDGKGEEKGEEKGDEKGDGKGDEKGDEKGGEASEAGEPSKKETSNLIDAVQGEGGPKPSEDVEEPKEE